MNDDPCCITAQNSCRIARLEPNLGDVSFRSFVLQYQKFWSQILRPCCNIVLLYFDLLLPVDLNERIQAGESDSTIYYNCDDHFSHVDYDNETDQVLGNCQEVSSSEGTLDREGILMLYI